jgi:hypothetical protein
MAAIAPDYIEHLFDSQGEKEPLTEMRGSSIIVVAVRRTPSGD